MDAGLLNVVEIGQYFMTKDTAEISQVQCLVVSTLCQEMKKHLDRKIASEGTLKLGPFWELHFVAGKVKYEVEIRIMSMNKDNSHSWLKQVGHEFEQQEQKPQKCSTKKMR